MTASRSSARGRSSARKRTAVPRDYDRASAERYWGDERRRLKDEFRIVLSAGEPADSTMRNSSLRRRRSSPQ